MDKTLVEIMSKLSESEVKDLCFCVNYFKPRGVGGIIADCRSVKYFKKKYAEDCLKRAVTSNKITSEGREYMLKLLIKLESL